MEFILVCFDIRFILEESLKDPSGMQLKLLQRVRKD